jgi:DNA-cytosine methyltransferase
MSITSKPNPTVVSLFAGCGGSSLGYKQAGFDVRLAVEWDTGAADVYRRNFPGANIFEGDIADLTAEEALRAATLEPGELDVLDGSPPCQGFSTAGHRKFSDSRNRLFEEYVRMIEVFKPKMLVMENVSGLRKGKMKLIFAEMTRALKDAGYKISCRELNAWWYGVPQDRRRLIWVGVREDLAAVPGHPEPTVTVPVSAGRALGIAGTQLRNPDFENKWKSGSGSGPSLKATYPPSISIDTNHYNHAKDWQSANRVIWSMRASQKPRIANAGIEVNYGSKVEIRDFGKVGPTLKTGGPPRIIRSTTDRESVRYLTIEESKILQGFPEWFDIQEKEYKFLGNSVCPPMAEAIGRHLMTLLEEV